MRLSKTDKETIYKLHLQSGKSSTEIKDFFDQLFLLILLSYYNNSEVKIPHIGTLKVNITDVKLFKERQIPNFEITITPEDSLKEIIEDAYNGKMDSIEAFMKKKITLSLESNMEA